MKCSRTAELIGLSAVGLGVVGLAVVGLGAVVLASSSAKEPIDKAVVSVRKVIEDDDLVLVEAEISVPARSQVRVGSEDPGGGGVMVLAGAGGDESTETVTLLLLADQIDRAPWDGAAEGLTAWRLQYQLRHRGGSAGGPTTNIERTRPPLADRLQVSLKAGTYDLGSPIEAFRFDGETYQLSVEPPAR